MWNITARTVWNEKNSERQMGFEFVVTPFSNHVLSTTPTDTLVLPSPQQFFHSVDAIKNRTFLVFFRNVFLSAWVIRSIANWWWKWLSILKWLKQKKNSFPVHTFLFSHLFSSRSYTFIATKRICQFSWHLHKSQTFSVLSCSESR